MEKKLKECTLNGIPLMNLPYLAIGDKESHRIYYRLHDDDKMNGFDFVVLEAASWASSSGKKWHENTEIDHIVSGNAVADGLKHTYFGEWKGKIDDFIEGESNIRGYLFYPDSKSLQQIFMGLNTLESMYCGTSLAYSNLNKEGENI